MPKPSALEKAQGNPSHRTPSAHEPVPLPGEIVKPPFMTPDGIKVWNAIAPLLIPIQLLTPPDAFAFGRYCELTARFMELKKIRDGRGSMGWSYKQGKSGYIGVLPQASEERQLIIELRMLEAQFGLTPAARARVRIDPLPGAIPAGASATAPKKNEDLQDFFSGGGRRQPGDRPPLVG